MKPKPYNKADPAEVARWFKEMEGYLNVEGFVKQGADREGRQFAHEALFALKPIMLGKEMKMTKTEGTPVICPRCNHEWTYKGLAWWVTCPRCRKLIKNPKEMKKWQ